MSQDTGQKPVAKPLPSTTTGPVVTLIVLMDVRIGHSGEHQDRRGRRWVALSLVLSFVLTGGAGVLAIYPYGGSRHDAFLMVFMAAGISIAVFGPRAWQGPSLARGYDFARALVAQVRSTS